MATTWHRIGDVNELRARMPCAVRVDRHAVALFHHDGRFRAIGNACNHKGCPLCEGRMRDEYVVCPWHGWEHSVVTGHGPAGYDEEQVPVFDVEECDDGVYVATPPRERRNGWDAEDMERSGRKAQRLAPAPEET